MRRSNAAAHRPGTLDHVDRQTGPGEEDRPRKTIRACTNHNGIRLKAHVLTIRTGRDNGELRLLSEKTPLIGNTNSSPILRIPELEFRQPAGRHIKRCGTGAGRMAANHLTTARGERERPGEKANYRTRNLLVSELSGAGAPLRALRITFLPAGPLRAMIDSPISAIEGETP